MVYSDASLSIDPLNTKKTEDHRSYQNHLNATPLPLSNLYGNPFLRYRIYSKKREIIDSIHNVWKPLLYNQQHSPVGTKKTSHFQALSPGRLLISELLQFHPISRRTKIHKNCDVYSWKCRVKIIFNYTGCSMQACHTSSTLYIFTGNLSKLEITYYMIFIFTMATKIGFICLPWKHKTSLRQSPRTDYIV